MKLSFLDRKLHAGTFYMQRENIICEKVDLRTIFEKEGPYGKNCHFFSCENHFQVYPLYNAERIKLFDFESIRN